MQSSIIKEKISKLAATAFRKGCWCDDCRPELYKWRSKKRNGRKPKYKDKR